MTTKRETSFKDRERRQVALASKYVRDHRHNLGYDSKGNKSDPIPPTALLNNISQRTAGVLNDIESITQLLPDTELMVQILVSSILSPKDLGEPKLQFESESNLGDDELNNKFLNIIEDYFTEDYRINEKLASILTEALITKGAYIEAIIPESGLDKLINPEGRISLEAARAELNDDLTLAPIGLVKDINETKDSAKSIISLENFYVDNAVNSTTGYKLFDNITLNDNPDTLKVPNVLRKITESRQSEILEEKYSLESYNVKDKVTKVKLSKLKGKSHRDIVDAIDNNRTTFRNNAGFMELTEGDLETTIGHPVTMKIPVESMIVVFSPGKPEDPLGGFVILDQFGNPIDLTSVADHYRNLQAGLSRTSGESAVSSMLSELRGSGLSMSGTDSVNQQVEEVVRTFSQLIERRLLNSISSGFEDKGLKLSHSNDIYTTMLGRSLANQNTQVLYVPSEMFSYIAFNYGKNGIGKSILEDSRILGSLRVLMMFSNTMAAVKNSTNRTELNINFDPTDTDPLSSATMVKDAFMRARAEGYPLGEGDPSAIIKYLQAANVDVVYGNHPDLPEMTVESTDKTTNKAMVDSELMDTLREWYIMSLGLSPETVDNGKNVDFATSIVVSNLLLSKRVIIYQTKYERQLADKIKTYTKYSRILMDKLIGAVEEHGNSASKGDVKKTIEKFLRKLSVRLPRPDSASLESKMQSFDDYEAALEKAITYYIDSEFITNDTAGEMGDHIDDVKSAIKAYYMRRYMKDYNILPELEEMVAVDDNGKSIFKFDEIQNTHVSAIMGSIEKYLKRSLSNAKKRNKRLSDLEEKLEAEEESEPEEAEDTGTEPAEDTGTEPIEGAPEPDDGDEAESELDGDEGELEAPDEP